MKYDVDFSRICDNTFKGFINTVSCYEFLQNSQKSKSDLEFGVTFLDLPCFTYVV